MKDEHRIYRLLRATHPTIPARSVWRWVNDPGGETLEQSICRHQWNRSAGEADEARMSGDYANDNIRCVKCGADGDA